MTFDSNGLPEVGGDGNGTSASGRPHLAVVEWPCGAFGRSKPHGGRTQHEPFSILVGLF